MKQLIRNFVRHDAGGNATVEFVIIFPLLALWMGGSFLFYDAFRSLTLTEKVAFTVSDIASRHESVDETDVAYMMALQKKMLPPRLDNWASRITSICFEDDTYKVMWSYAESDPGVEGYLPHTDATIPLEVMPAMAAQDSIILTEVEARWTPLLSGSGMTERRWINRLVEKPRFVQIVPHETLNSDTICPKIVETSGT